MAIPHQGFNKSKITAKEDTSIEKYDHLTTKLNHGPKKRD